MVKYLKENLVRFIILFVVVVLLGPLFSFVLSIISKYLDVSMGDWLGFYGAVFGMVISVWIVHFQMTMERNRERIRFQPEFLISNDYQMIKKGSKVYFNNKFWYFLEKNRQHDDFVTSNSFEKQYDSQKNRMDKALSIEILNNQPIFNLCIQLDDKDIYERISRLGVEEKVYFISQVHLRRHQEAWFKGKKFEYSPSKVTLYYTTLIGDTMKNVYTVDDRGICILKKSIPDIDYSDIARVSKSCEYFIKST